MNYSHEVINMKCIKQGLITDLHQFLKKVIDKSKRNQDISVCHTVSAGVHHNRDQQVDFECQEWNH